MSDGERVLVCVSASPALHGRLIRWLLKSRVNHAFLIYRSKLWGGWWAAQIDEKGVRKLPAKPVVCEEGKVRYFECKLSLNAGLRSMREYVGARYDWLALFWNILRLLCLRLFHIKIHRVYDSTNKFICFEFVVGVLRGAKIPGTERWEPISVSPEKCLEFLESSSAFEEVNVPAELVLDVGA